MMHDPLHLAEEPRHLRNAARCGAKTRAGGPCRSPSVAGKGRCRMHGCAKRSGGPKGAHNGNYKHGRYTAETIASRRWLRRRIREVRALTRNLGGPPGPLRGRSQGFARWSLRHPKETKQRAASPGHVDAAGQQVSAAVIYLECLSIVAIRGTKLWEIRRVFCRRA